MIIGSKLAFEDNPPFDHPSTYRSLIGALQYLTLTRPDLSFVVNKLSQFLKAPIVNHWQACKHVLRYVQGPLHHGLTFTKSDTLQLEGYADVDWASNISDRKSTSGYCIFLGSNLVQWSSKKQAVVVLSSARAEYRALAQASIEIAWL
ncbi:secreted RxLR effector protein 161-like [Pistacia vera]|uniref:secreted RxLR effector protein 161-like n=1 Tax=Pistacia vera TaxID=55513 RepID=UPI001262CA32|nr:secreted RxLR effector protein 161-like [Pistacia vera]